MCGRFKLTGALFILAMISAGAHGGQYADQLRSECDAMIESAIHRAYGWAWGQVGDNASAHRPAPVPVRFEPLTTPAAGLVLLWSGDLLNEPRYTHASQQAARGISAAVEGNGRVPNRANFGRAPVGIDALSASADRAPTIASLALLLTLQARNQIPDERTRRDMIQSANWLARQQTRAGAWPSAYPADARPNDALRIIRLDDSGYRDATLAMLLAHDVLKNPAHERAAVRAIDQLLALRVQQRGVIGRGLWRNIYSLDGTAPDRKVADASADIDVLAGRFSIQTLLAAYLMTAQRDWGLAANDATKVIESLRYPDGTWQRTYAARATIRPTTQDALAQNWTTGWFGLDAVLHTTAQIKLLGREKFITLLEARFDARHHLAQMLSGLSDQSLTLGFPLAREEIEPYLTQNETMFRPLDAPPPADLSGRVQRLWVLYLRTRIERMQEKT